MRGVEGFVFEEGFREFFNGGAALFEHALGAGVGFVNDAFDLGIHA